MFTRTTPLRNGSSEPKMSELAELQKQVEQLQQQLSMKRTVSSSSGGLPENKQLNGTNYAEWKFLMKNFLIDAGLWFCIEPNKENVIDPELDQRTLAKINLSIKPSASSETRNAKTAKEAWEALQKTYEDKGVVRRIGLYASLFRTNFENYTTMSDYIEHITSIADQLNGIGKPLDDETVGGIILGGLPEKFRPLILGIQGSNQSTTVDFVKNLLLQENVKEMSCTSSPSNQALFTTNKSKEFRHQQKRKNTRKPPGPRCYNCNEIGHLSSSCPKQSRRSTKKNHEKDDHKINLFSSTGSELKPEHWYLDSGCNQHMSPRSDWLKNLIPQANQKIDVANGGVVEAEGCGTVTISLANNSTANVQDVILAPELTTNLLSISQIARQGKTVIFDAAGCRVVKTQIDCSENDIIATATIDRGLYRLDTKELIASTVVVNSHDVWHRRLAHLNRKDMKLLQTKMCTGMDPEPDPQVPCVSCLKGKQNRLPFPKTAEHRARNVLDLVHSDLCGPIETTSLGGARYFLTFTDDYSRKSFVYFLKTKDEALQKFEDFKVLVENQTSRSIKILRSDNGGEYISNKFHSFLKRHGIQHQLTVPRTPEQNGVSERLNKTLVEKARTMLIDAELSKDLWAEAVNTANYLKNRSPTKAVRNMTPEEAWSGTKPDLSHLRIFGCKALVHVPKTLRKKFDAKAEEQIFVGYAEQSKGYRLIHPDTKKITIARDIVFIETKLSYEKSAKDESSIDKENSTVEENPVEMELVDVPVTCKESDEADYPSEISEEEEGTEDRPSRNRIPNKRIFNDDFIVYKANQHLHQDPQTYEEALTTPEAQNWIDAMKEELQAHKSNKTWELCDLPPGRKAIKSRWTFKTKYDANGEIERYKARLVAKGCSQKYGIDFQETFSPTVRHSSIRFLLSLAAKHDLDLDQMDVVTAFLHPKLEEQIYMELPENTQSKHQFCRLNKSIYGLKQASRVWYQELDKTLCKLGLQRAKSDPCIFFKSDSESLLIVAVYVDDLLILSNSKNDKQHLKNELKQTFKMKDLGEAHHILGMRINRDREKGTITLDQTSYIKNMLYSYGMEDCKEACTPLALGQTLSKEMSPKTEEDRRLMEEVPYRQAIGSLLYVAQGTRPDICHAVGVLSRFSNDPGPSHWSAVKRVFRYLKKTADKTLSYNKQGDLSGYSDSDWANDKDDRRSTTGYIFCNAGSAISWNSKKQPTVALSTTESEYMALCAATQELAWLSRLSAEITGIEITPVQLSCDNQGAISLASNPIFSPRAKHIDTKHHFVREKVEEGVAIIRYVESCWNVADMLTKAVSTEQLQKFNKLCGLV